MGKSTRMFMKNGIIISLTQEIAESNEIFIERAYYVLDKVFFNYKDNKNNKNIEYYVNLSRIWANIKFKNMVYSADIMKLIF